MSILILVVKIGEAEVEVVNLGPLDIAGIDILPVMRVKEINKEGVVEEEEEIMSLKASRAWMTKKKFLTSRANLNLRLMNKI